MATNFDDYTLQKKSELVALAQAVRNKTVTTEALSVSQMTSKIRSLPIDTVLTNKAQKLKANRTSINQKAQRYRDTAGVSTDTPYNYSAYILSDPYAWRDCIDGFTTWFTISEQSSSAWSRHTLNITDGMLFYYPSATKLASDTGEYLTVTFGAPSSKNSVPVYFVATSTNNINNQYQSDQLLPTKSTSSGYIYAQAAYIKPGTYTLSGYAAMTTNPMYQASHYGYIPLYSDEQCTTRLNTLSFYTKYVNQALPERFQVFAFANIRATDDVCDFDKVSVLVDHTTKAIIKVPSTYINGQITLGAVEPSTANTSNAYAVRQADDSANIIFDESVSHVTMYVSNDFKNFLDSYPGYNDG